MELSAGKSFYGIFPPLGLPLAPKNVGNFLGEILPLNLGGAQGPPDGLSLWASSSAL